MAIELFGNEWKEELFEDLVKLNIEAMKEANRRISKQFNMVPIKEVMKLRVGEEQELKILENKESSAINKTQKVVNTCMTWMMY